MPDHDFATADGSSPRCCGGVDRLQLVAAAGLGVAAVSWLAFPQWAPNTAAVTAGLALWLTATALVRAARRPAPVEREVPALPPPPAEPAPSPPAPPAPDDGLPYRDLFNGNPHPMWVIDDATLAFLDVNDAVVNKYGYPRDELRALTVRDVSPAEDVDGLTGAGHGPDPGRLTSWRHRTKAGVLLQSDVACCRVGLGGRKVRLVVASDVTDLNRATAALREREDLLRTVIANAPVGVFWKDRASIYLGCNDRVARDYGLEVPGEVVGRSDYELMTPAAAERSRAVDRQVVRTGEPYLNAEEAHARPDGTKATWLVSKVPLRDAGGAVVGVLGVYQDITDRTRLEDQLRQAQKMEAIGRLAGGIAHDFNNLLTIILGTADILREDGFGPRALEMVTDIHGAATRATAMTRQLLTFSHRQPARLEVLDLNELVASLAALLRRLLGERVTVAIAPAAHPVHVRADRSKLEQVVMNLSVNARDAMPEGGTLTIATAAATAGPKDGDRPARVARLCVSDTGVGMSEAVQAQIFEPFFTTKEVGRGTGLGLSTVYGIVKQAGGHIDVESAPGAGTTFRIDFPACEAADGPPRSSVEVPMPAVPNRADGRTALVVEDEAGLRKLARAALEGQGYAVETAGSAEAALELFALDGRIDLLVTDMVMPGMDGRGLADRVRAERPTIAVVFVSGYVRDCDRVDGVPGSVFLPKPYTPGDLVRAAERAVRRSARSRPAQETLTP